MKIETAKREIESLDDYLLNHTDDYSVESHTAMMMAIDALNNADVLDKIDEIITDALDKSTDQKESQTLRWVLDKISEVT